MIEEIRDLFQTLIAPQLESIKGEIRAALSVIDAYRRELLAEIHRVEDTLSSDFVRIEEKVDTRLLTMNQKLDLHRRELLAEIRAALK